MKPAELRASVSYDDFRPFRMLLTDGRVIACEDRSHYAMADGRCIVVFEKEGGGPTILSCEQIEAIKPLSLDPASP